MEQKGAKSAEKSRQSGLGPSATFASFCSILEVCPVTVGKLGIYSFNGKSQAVEQKAAERAKVGGLEREVGSPSVPG